MTSKPVHTDLDLQGTSRIKGVPAPLANDELANKQYTDERFSSSNTVRVKPSNVGAGEFSDIQLAIDSVSGLATPTNPYLVEVDAGVYVGTLTMAPNVFVRGAGIHLTIIQPTSGDHIIYGADNSGISDCLLTGASTAGKAAIYYESLTGNTNTTFWVRNVKFGANDTQAIADASTAASSIIFTGCVYGAGYSFNHGFLGRNGGRVVLLSCTTVGLTAPYPDYVFKAIGAGSQVVLNGVQCRSGGLTSGACIHLADGALLRASGVNIRMFAKALWIENIGAGSVADANSILCEGNTMDLQVDHPDADGTFTGSADHTKVFIDPASTFSPVFACNRQPNDGTGQIVIGTILQGDRYDRFANISLLLRKGTMTGQVEGGDLSAVSGLQINVSAGFGFLLDPADLYLKEVPWVSTNITLPANSTNEIFAKYDGTIDYAPVLPSYTTVIPLGVISTTATDIRYISKTELNMNQYSNRVESFARETLKSTFGEGVIVTVGSSPLKLSNTNGFYNYGVANKLIVDTETDFEFEDIYHSSGSFTHTDTDTLNNTHYDNGTNPAALTAGYYTNRWVFVIGDSGVQKWFIVRDTAQYANESLARAAAVVQPLLPDYISGAVVRVAVIIVQEGSTSTIILDARPTIGGIAVSSSGAVKHDDLIDRNLDSNHPNLLRVNGTNAMTGNLDLGSNNIVNVNLINGINLSTALAAKQNANANLSALAAFASTGILVQSASNTFVARTVTGTAGNISVSNGDGIAGNPVLDLVNTGTAGTYGSASQVPVITTDIKGRVTGVVNTSINITASQVSDFSSAADARIALQKAAANGLATLDVSGKIPTSQLPALAITETFVVNSQVAMLALTAQTGDVAVRTDLNKSFILAGSNPATLGDWQELLTPTDAVLSVNGFTGAVTLTTDNVNEGGTNLYFTNLRASAAAPVQTVFGRTGNVVAATNDYTWAQINKAVSSFADITTRSATDINSGTLADARLSSNVALKNINNNFSASQTISVTGASSALSIAANGSQTNVARLTFTGTSGTGDFVISGDGGDVFWQGGGGRALQMAAFHQIDFQGGRNTGTAPTFLNGSNGTYNVRVLNSGAAQIGLVVRAAATPTGDFLQVRTSAETVLGGWTAAGNAYGQNPTANNHYATRAYSNGLITTADVASTSSTTMTQITEHQWSAVAGSTYRFKAVIAFRTTATTSGIALTLDTPNTAVGTIAAMVQIVQSSDGIGFGAAIYDGAITSLGDLVISTDVPATNTDYIAVIEGIFRCTTSGTMGVEFRREAGGGQTVTYRAGSVLELRTYN